MIGRKLADRYEIIERIGDGGMSTVYRGQCHVLNRPVAIKILKEEFVDDKVFVDRFDQEAKSAASIQHANIVNVFDVGVEDDIHYIVMELLSARTLKDFIEEQTVYLSTQEIVRIGLQIAEALQVAHDKGIVHRDIKPQNILMTEDGHLKVADFGIARAATRSTMINTKEAIGSVHYSSPEQSRGNTVDKRTDIYSLGILLYELATGRVPFEGETPIAVALKHLKENPIPPHLVNVHLNLSLEQLILKCISKEPINRYQNVYEIIEELEHLQRNPVEKVVVEGPKEEKTFTTKVLPKLPEENYDKPYMEINGEDDEPAAKVVIKPLFIAAAILGIVVAFAMLATTLNIPIQLQPNGEPQEKFFELIDIEKMDYADAVEALSAKNLSLEVTERRYSDALAKEQIISQHPKAGTMVKPGQKIAVVVSNGSRLEELPNLQGKTIEEARVILSNIGAKLGATDEETSTFERGLIIAQDPIAGTAIQNGAIVNIVISSGEELEKVEMPDLKDKSKDEALQLLTENGLVYGEIGAEYSETVKEDYVISQSIEAGSEVDEQTIVDFVISLGIDPASVSAQIGTTGEAGSTKTFRVPLSGGKEAQAVEVKKVVDGDEQLLYGKVHRLEEQIVVLNIKGEGQQTLRFYIDGALVDEKVVDFSGE